MATAIDVPGIITIQERTAAAFAEVSGTLFLTGNARQAENLPDAGVRLAAKLADMIPEVTLLVLDLIDDDEGRERAFREQLFPGIADALKAAGIDATYPADGNTIFLSPLED